MGRLWVTHVQRSQFMIFGKLGDITNYGSRNCELRDKKFVKSPLPYWANPVRQVRRRNYVQTKRRTRPPQKRPFLICKERFVVRQCIFAHPNHVFHITNMKIRFLPENKQPQPLDVPPLLCLYIEQHKGQK